MPGVLAKSLTILSCLHLVRYVTAEVEFRSLDLKSSLPYWRSAKCVAQFAVIVAVRDYDEQMVTMLIEEICSICFFSSRIL